MKGKASSTTVFPFSGVVIWERGEYDKNLANIAKSGGLVGCVVVENTPESWSSELEHFANCVLRGS